MSKPRKKKKKKQNLFVEFMGFVDTIVKWLCLAMMSVMVIAVLLQVLTRYVLASPFSWTEEIARFLLIWISFLAASHIARTSSYIRVDFFVMKLPLKAQKGVNIFCKLLMLGFSGFFAIQSFLVYTTVSAHEVAPATQLPMIIPRSALFVGQALVFIQMLCAGGLVLLNSQEEVDEDL